VATFLTTFPNQPEFERARLWLGSAGVHHEVVSPLPGYRCVGVPALVVEDEERAILTVARSEALVCSGWVAFRPTNLTVPPSSPPAFEVDIFGRCAIMVLAPCVADEARIRLVAHISGDLGPVMPYLNATMPAGLYCPDGPTFTFMEGPRMVSLYSHRITVAKADEIVDAWRVLERVRVLASEVWQRRETISPCHATRHRPPALEVYRRLPGTNCRVCGEKTCMAFALRLWKAEVSPAQCEPVFAGRFGHLLPALLAICAGLGVDVTGLTEGAVAQASAAAHGAADDGRRVGRVPNETARVTEGDQ
jgi:ArsR family metal-binding transcriptional regulator